MDPRASSGGAPMEGSYGAPALPPQPPSRTDIRDAIAAEHLRQLEVKAVTAALNYNDFIAGGGMAPVDEFMRAELESIGPMAPRQFEERVSARYDRQQPAASLTSVMHPPLGLDRFWEVVLGMAGSRATALERMMNTRVRGTDERCVPLTAHQEAVWRDTDGPAPMDLEGVAPRPPPLAWQAGGRAGAAAGAADYAPDDETTQWD